MSYDSSSGIDDEINRLTAIVQPNSVNAVSYTYMGIGRLIFTVLGNNISRTYDDERGGHIIGLDGFGRVLDMTYISSGQKVLSYGYGYDKRGNRTFQRTENHIAGNSWRYEYDGLSRLTNARQGDFPTGGTDFVSPQPTEVNIWNLDGVGNWSGDLDSRSYLRFDDANYNLQWDAGETVHEGAHHVTGSDNEIDELLGIASDGTVATEGQKFFYDGAGNLLFNGDRYFVYDAWNRLTEIHEPGSLDIDTTGVETELSGTEGNCLTIFRYDALGRKALTVTDPGLASEKTIRHLYGTGADVLVEYDVDGSTESLERWFINGQSFPDPIVMVDRTGSGGTTSGTDTYYYYLKDALGSVAALADMTGAVVEHYAYDPYGQTYIYNDTGTSGLTESAYGNPFLWTAQRYDPDNGMYHFVHRPYEISLGRFVQADPNGSGLPVMMFSIVDGKSCLECADCDGCSTCDSCASCGECDGRGDWEIEFDPWVQYGDGQNLYAYAGAAPTNHIDAYGLMSIASVLVGTTSSTRVRAGYDSNAINSANIALRVLLAVGITVAWNYDYDDIIDGTSPRTVSPGRSHCHWFYAWCKWAVQEGHKGPRNKDWPRNVSFSACEACYGTCLTTGAWPVTGPCRQPKGAFNPEDIGKIWPD